MATLVRLVALQPLYHVQQGEVFALEEPAAALAILLGHAERAPVEPVPVTRRPSTRRTAAA